MRLKDRVALVTGASGGLGKHFCKALLKEGAKVGVTDIARDMVDDAVASLDDSGSTIGAVVDV
ncbi:MAG: SDR family NAD(P)-dependent oxidoreductase, partial [Deltaproteobacteria bacterium]|nr:SDR family NAD(P)-dependent oxidoreductase [Deltaproteobacteria bacterium]